MAKGRVILERRYVPTGTVIMEEGEIAYSAFIIQSGTVSVYSLGDKGEEIELARLGIGEICGEMALINDGERTANVKAVEDCNLVIITRTAFEDKLRSSDITIQAVVKMLIERMKSANTNVLGKKGNIEDMICSTYEIYNNIKNRFPDKKAAEFEKKVQPKLDAFLNAVKKFS